MGRRFDSTLALLAFGSLVASGCGSSGSRDGARAFAGVPGGTGGASGASGAGGGGGAPGGCEGVRSDGRCLSALVEDIVIGVETHDSFVYYATLGSEIARVPTGGGEAELLVEDERVGRELALTESELYWGRVPSGAEENAAVMRAPQSGGTPEMVVSPPLTDPLFAIERDSLFWLDRLDGSVWRGPLDGSNPEELYRESTLNPWGLVAHEGYLYFRGGTSSSPLLRLAQTGGELETVAIGGNAGTVGPFVQGAYVYWVNCMDGTLERAPLAGGETRTLTTWPEDEVIEWSVVLVDEGAVYFTRDPEPNTDPMFETNLYKLAHGASDPELLFQGRVEDLASDGTSLFIAETGHLYRLTPK